MTTTIYLSPDDAPHMLAVCNLVEEIMMRDPDWNGASIGVALGDFTCVENCEEIAGTALLGRVHDVCVEANSLPSLMW